MPAARLALAISAFGIDTTEFVIMGLLRSGSSSVLGGQAIESGLGYTAPDRIGALLAAAGLAVALGSGLLDRKSRISFETGERVPAR